MSRSWPVDAVHRLEGTLLPSRGDNRSCRECQKCHEFLILVSTTVVAAWLCSPRTVLQLGLTPAQLRRRPWQTLPMSPTAPRELLLSSIWEGIRAWGPAAVKNVAAAGRAAESGADPADLVALMRVVAYDTAFGLLALLDEHGSERAPFGAPGWALVAATERHDGRLDIGGAAELECLHEDLLTSDPTGQEGADFLT